MKNASNKHQLILRQTGHEHTLEQVYTSYNQPIYNFQLLIYFFNTAG